MLMDSLHVEMSLLLHLYTPQACREGDRRRRFKMRSQAVKMGKCILVFGVAFVIVTLIVVIVVVASTVSTRTDDSS